MKVNHDNSVRLERVKDREWREALDELTVYLGWRLYGRTETGAHSEKELGMPALTYYQEEAVVKLIEGEWKWQERFSLGKQLERIAASLITKQCEKHHSALTQSQLLTEQNGLIMIIKNNKDMTLLEKIEKFDAEAKKAEVVYKGFGTSREAHHDKMMEFIHRKIEEARKK